MMKAYLYVEYYLSITDISYGNKQLKVISSETLIESSPLLSKTDKGLDQRNITILYIK